MATLPGQRAQFTWALKQYNLAENDAERAFYAKRMAKYVGTAEANGFTIDQITKGQPYPAAEVAEYVREANYDGEPDLTETQAVREVEEAVDTSNVLRLGQGDETVYAYGYRCAPDRLKVGLTTGDTVPRIVAQISTSTPDKPVLLLEIRTHDCASLERAIQAILEYRGYKIAGGGKEWFKASRDEIVSIYHLIVEQGASSSEVTTGRSAVSE